ncbi:hypothetical protein DPM13_12615 [Paracoccus mutanolyticus]|uniref:Uncharacterized protein n=1 Tax=Paracoccus mutanolyticus TaxID=1499308 RepID=A0ABN5MBH6_9RHOB|nr:hypothetical protein DPM13_12615 [Paracoccus mutanolyticus]
MAPQVSDPRLRRRILRIVDRGRQGHRHPLHPDFTADQIELDGNTIRIHARSSAAAAADPPCGGLVGSAQRLAAPDQR